MDQTEIYEECGPSLDIE